MFRVLMVAFVSLLMQSNQLGAQYPARGGSNFAWYGPPGQACYDPVCFDTWYAISNYDRDTVAIDTALQDIYNSGQRKLRLPIYHSNVPGTACNEQGARETVMTSTYLQYPNALAPQCITNLTNLLETIRQKGFNEVMISFHPQQTNVPQNWTTWSPYLYAENKAVVFNVRNVVAQAGLAYRIDLLNEGMPNNYEITNRALGQYAQTPWNDYRAQFGTWGTVGFSVAMANDYQERINNFSYVYGGVFPPVFSLHLRDDVFNRYVWTWQTMASRGWTQGWIIGEAYYNDANNAQLSKQDLLREHGLLPDAVAGRPVRRLVQPSCTIQRVCHLVVVARDGSILCA